MTTKPFFSIVTVSFDNLEGLKRTYNSIADQASSDFEWVVIDGGSSDGTREFLESQNLGDWVSEADSGPYDAMNKGLDRICGAYVIFMNAGDVFASSDVLCRVHCSILAHDSPIVFYGDALEVADNGLIKYKKARRYNGASVLFTHHQAIFYDRMALGKMRYGLQYKIAADYDFTMRFLTGANSVHYTPFPVCVFEGCGLSAKRRDLGRKELFDIRKRLRLVGAFENYFIYVRQWLASMLKDFFTSAYWFLRQRF